MILKKSISVFLAYMLLVSNLGIAFNIHYCGNSITEISAVPKPEMKSCCGGSAKKCCANKIISVRKTSENTISKSVVIDVPVILPLIVTPAFTSADKLSQSFPRYAFGHNCHAPPLYKLYSQYLFYA